ncbi:PH domain-containing protein [Mycobacterium frederiksbergense]|uniref:PH domain-containing protein n=1 Tax=Mycolicibacterium frederiksbergense TaxID=117567 RepID=UPI0021F28FB7|nr:PH domain-containing protein [Mycolicibacterium frederiksbergense]MBX9921637.1 PH domain-containing protein [Mycolicibacterium frederiksbergense]MCV7043618.1 PH domain-containing protein [Mycolicibacterium frederiksbergense]MDO0973106.1 PH domain-containing protein [Mycolicibacterium frederiksbergense]
MSDTAWPPNMQEWQRLSPRMLLVHPVHEVLNQLPLLIGAIVLGSATQNPVWSLVGVGLIVVLGLARWFTTSYRIDDRDVTLRTGLLQRNELSVPRNRIRSVQTEARLLHRLLGLTVLRVSTGQEAKGDNAFELDAVRSDQVVALRALLLGEHRADAPEAERLASWEPSWLRYSALSWSGLLMIGAALGVAYQAGFGDVLHEWVLMFGGAWLILAAVSAGVVLAVGRSLLTYGNLVLTRRADTLHLVHGLLKIREHTYDLRRLRGGTLREPLLVRALGGARLDAVMTGVAGAGESSLLLPACPAGTARRVLTELVAEPGVVDAALVAHGPAATRRRWVRAMVFPVVLAAVLVLAPLPGWVWGLWVVLVGCCVLLALDRVRALGHRVDGRWLVTRAGSVERRRDCVQTAGIIGWTVRQTWFQRRAGVATLVAATAAGTKRYVLIDVPAELAWTVAATASPWVADSQWYA